MRTALSACLVTSLIVVVSINLTNGHALHPSREKRYSPLPPGVPAIRSQEAQPLGPPLPPGMSVPIAKRL